ncbi:uncharacterized protein haspin isoform X2 [Vanacampus margaritifer]
MTTVKPIFMRTYGKKRRKLTSWISPKEHRQAFDSSDSTDDSLDEHIKYTKIRKRKPVSVAAAVTKRGNKKCLIITESEDNLSFSVECQKNQAKKGKKKRQTRRKGKENIPDEDVVSVPLASCPQPAPRDRTTRKKAAVTSKRKMTRCPTSSESGKDLSSPAKRHKSSLQINNTSYLPHLPLGCFVTCRQCRPVTTKPKVSNAKGNAFNFLDGFTSGEESQNCLPHKKKTVPRANVDLSVENSSSDLDSNPVRNMLLNDSADLSIGSQPRKPIFSSTPSVRLSSKRPHIVQFPNTNQSLNPTSLSVSRIDAHSCQDDQNSPNQPSSSSPVVLHSDKKQQLNEQTRPPVHEVHSMDLFIHPRTMDITSLKNDATSGSLHLLTADCENGSCFGSRVEDLLSLTEFLKEKCLSQRCNVRVKRLDSLTLNQLSRKNAYSSCLADINSAHRRPTAEQQLIFMGNVLSPELLYKSCLAATRDETDRRSTTRNELESVASDIPVSLALLQSLLAENPFMEASTSAHTESTKHTRSISESETSNIPISLALSQSQSPLAESEFMEASTSAHNESTQHSSSSLEFFSCEQFTGSFPGQMSASKQVAYDSFQGKKTKVALKRLELEEIKRAISPKLSVGRSISIAVGTQSRAESLSMALIQKCRTDKLIVRIQRLTSTQLKELQRKGRECKSSTNGPDVTSEDLTSSKRQNNHDQNTSCKGVEEGLSNSDKIVDSGKEASNKHSRVDQQASGPDGKKKKTRKNPFMSRPGTTRKACVSGLSVSRWKNDSSLQAPCALKRKSPRRAADCTIDDLIPAQPDGLEGIKGHAMNFSTPVRARPLNLSLLLADFTPNWNRLKSSLSIHRKVLITPESSKNLVPTDLSQLLYDSGLSDAEKVYTECGQWAPLPWKECFSALQMRQCVKIGEGTFGEVFSTSNLSGETVALKVIPLEGSEKVNGEDQKTFGEILHEIIISKELSSLKEKQYNQTSCFIGLNNLHCVQGCYPPELLKAWDTFKKKKCSENDRPDLFENDQLFLILEFEFGGVDLENNNGKLSSVLVAKSILHQVTAALAVAEQQLHFEHRDLHWGNVLVKTTKQKTASFLLNGEAHSLETKGVCVRIIDYTLSRLEIDGLTVSCDIANDEALFLGQGDYQFDIYRLMQKENGNKWSDYHPHSNVLWLHYLCSKLLSMKYRGKGSKDARKELSQFHDDILRYASATEALQTCPMFY